MFRRVNGNEPVDIRQLQAGEMGLVEGSFSTATIFEDAGRITFVPRLDANIPLQHVHSLRGVVMIVHLSPASSGRETGEFNGVDDGVCFEWLQWVEDHAGYYKTGLFYQAPHGTGIIPLSSL